MVERRVPEWPGHATGTRVLVECDDQAVQDGLERALRAAGYTTAACAGPDSRGGHCPLVEDGRCGLVADADAVVQAFDPARPDLTTVLEAIRVHQPATPVVLEVSAGAAGAAGAEARHADVLAECRAVRFPITTGAVLAALQDVIPSPADG